MLDAVVFSDDEGIVLDYTVLDGASAAIDISDANTTKFTIHKPDGSESDVDAAFVTDGTDGKLKYVYTGAFGQVGLWKYRAWYQNDAGKYHTAWLEFYVQEPSPIIEDWGGEDSNCYIALTAANSFVMSSIVDTSAWSDATPQQRNAALMEATRDIDAHEYLGQRYFYNQMLQFPRELLGSWPWNRTTQGNTGFSIEQHRMQVAVEQATCYQALAILRKGGRDIDQERIASGIRSFREQAGQAEEETVYSGTSAGSKLCPDALNRLRQYRSQKTIYRG